MIIDFHAHIGFSKDGVIQTLNELKKSMSKLGINKCVIFPFDEKFNSPEEYSVKILKQSKNNKSFLPFFRFDPKRMTREKLRDILSNGFYGVKLHSHAENFDPLSKKFFPLYKEIANLDKPLLLHVKKYHLKRTDPMRAVRLGKLIPNLKLVIAHFASSQPLVFEYVKKHKLKNVYFDTSIHCSQFYITKIGKKIGFDKILFASDCPYSDQEVELLKIKKLKINKENKKKILGLNAERLLKIKKRNKD